MRQGVAIFVAAGVVAATLPFIRDHDEALLSLLGKAKVAVTGGEQPLPQKTIDPPPLAGIELQYIDDRRDVVTAPAHGKRNAELTIDPVAQQAALGFLRRGRVHEGAVVMTDIRTGRVIVWANYNHGRPRDVASEANRPSASVFKVVTGAALIEAGVSLNDKICYSGGRRRITERELEADEKRDKYCASLGMAMGRSINTVFARQAVTRLDPEKLTGAAKRLGWGLDIPFDVPIEQSSLDIPQNDRLEFARAAAGFWHTTLSPFQGANLAQTIANGGEMVRTTLVERVLDEDGEVLYQRPKQRQVFKRVLDERTAWAVARMMEQTVRNGSAFKAFHDRAGRPFLPDIAVAGKTGTLAKKEHGGETLITWWVGFAPADKPEVALSVLVTNRGPWRVKGMHVAADMLRFYFADQGVKGVRYPPGFSGP
ncbi:MAG: penicillin-binding protein, partial [Deltaproteobacteria bacterium]